MSKKLEDVFGIENIEEIKATPGLDSHIMDKPIQIYDALTQSEKIDTALTAVTDVDAHDVDMDSIASEAMTTFKEMMMLGKQVPDAHAGRIFESAASMLDIALRAKDSKNSKKLKVIELQLKKLKLDKANGPEQKEDDDTGLTFDRNDLLTLLGQKSSDNQTDK